MACGLGHCHHRPANDVLNFNVIMRRVAILWLLMISIVTRKVQGQDSSSSSSTSVIVIENNNNEFVPLDNFDNLVELNNGAAFVMEQLQQVGAVVNQGTTTTRLAPQELQEQLLEQYSFLPLSSSALTTSSINYTPEIVLAFQKVTRGVYWKLILMIQIEGLEEEEEDLYDGRVCIGGLEVTLYFLGDYTVDEWGIEYTCDDAEQIKQGNYAILENEHGDSSSLPGSNTGGGGGGGGSNGSGSSTSGGIDRYTGCCYESIADYDERPELLNAAWFALQQLQRDDVDIIWPELIIDYSFLHFKKDVKYLYKPLIVEAFQQVVGGSNWKFTIMILSSSSSSEQGNNLAAANADECIGVFDVVIYNNYAGELSLTEWGNESPCNEFFDVDDNNEQPSPPKPPVTPGDDNNGDGSNESGADCWTSISPTVVATVVLMWLMPGLAAILN